MGPNLLKKKLLLKLPARSDQLILKRSLKLKPILNFCSPLVSLVCILPTPTPWPTAAHSPTARHSPTAQLLQSIVPLPTPTHWEPATAITMVATLSCPPLLPLPLRSN